MYILPHGTTPAIFAPSVNGLINKAYKSIAVNYFYGRKPGQG